MEKISNQVYSVNIEKDECIELRKKYKRQFNISKYTFLMRTLTGVEIVPIPKSFIRGVSKEVNGIDNTLHLLNKCFEYYFKLSNSKVVLVEDFELLEKYEYLHSIKTSYNLSVTSKGNFIILCPEKHDFIRTMQE